MIEMSMKEMKDYKEPKLKIPKTKITVATIIPSYAQTGGKAQQCFPLYILCSY